VRLLLAVQSAARTQRVTTAVSHVSSATPVAQQRMSGAVARRSRLEQHVLHLSAIKRENNTQKKEKENDTMKIIGR
jgi:hypothetical protein